MSSNALCKMLVFIDLNGTLHTGENVISRAIEGLQLLRSNSDRFCFKLLTNSSRKSQKNLFLRLVKLGFNVEESDMITSLTATYHYIKERNLRPMLFIDPDALTDFADINTFDPNCVVVGLAPNKFNFDYLNQAFKILLNDSTELIGVNKSRYFKNDTNELVLGSGAFVECLHFATGKTPKIIGKPESEFFLQSLKAASSQYNQTFEPSDVIMIGDDACDDVLGALNCGMKGILVKTGKYRTGDENLIPIEKRICVDDFYDAVQYIVKNYNL